MEQTERANRAKEIYEKHKLKKLEERVNLICKSYNESIEKFNEYVNSHKIYHKIVEMQVEDLEEQVKQLTQQKERFQHNLMYIEVVEDIIISKETEWENKTFNNMLVKLVGKDEVYKVFVQTSNSPVIGSKIKFTFNADENKLSQLKLM